MSVPVFSTDWPTSTKQQPSAKKPSKLRAPPTRIRLCDSFLASRRTTCSPGTPSSELALVPLESLSKPHVPDSARFQKVRVHPSLILFLIWKLTHTQSLHFKGKHFILLISLFKTELENGLNQSAQIQIRCQSHWNIWKSQQSAEIKRQANLVVVSLLGNCSDVQWTQLAVVQPEGGKDKFWLHSLFCSFTGSAKRVDVQTAQLSCSINSCPSCYHFRLLGKLTAHQFLSLFRGTRRNINTLEHSTKLLDFTTLSRFFSSLLFPS